MDSQETESSDELETFDSRSEDVELIYVDPSHLKRALQIGANILTGEGTV